MSTWHGYIGVMDVALTAPQRAAILAAFDALGPGDDPSPARLLHRRVALDGDKVIYEAAFNVSNLTVEHVKNFLAAAVGVDPGLIDDATQQTQYGPLVTYSAGGTDRMRFLVYAGLSATWDGSRQQAQAYILNNIEEWETE